MKPIKSEFEFFMVDLNGVLRGKRLPFDSFEKVQKEGIKLTRSVVGLDFWGKTS